MSEFEKLRTRLEEIFEDDIHELAYSDFSGGCLTATEEKTIKEFGEVEVVFEYGGEGAGEHWEKVWHFKDQGIYIKLVGTYHFYNGTYFDGGFSGLEKVQPVEKTITTYQPV